MSSSLKAKIDRKLNSYTPLTPTDETKDFLCDFFKILPLDGSKNLAADIAGCANDEQLRRLVQSIRTGLLIPMKAPSGKTPAEITSSPLSSFEYLSGFEDSIKPISGSSQSQIRQRCLERDGNRCVATGYYNHSNAHPRNALTTYLEVSHIIPFTLGSFQADDGEIWVNLRRYFPILCSMSFTSEQINSEKNALMLDSQLHRVFAQFKLIFEATGVAHQYRIKTFPGIATGPIQGLPRNCQVQSS